MKTKTRYRVMTQELFFPMIVLIHICFWVIDLQLYKGDYDFTVKHVAGEIFSSWVVTVFAVNFLMTTKARWVERIFGGLDKMYRIHRRSGIIAMILLTLHFIVIPMDPRFTIGKPLGILSYTLILIGVTLAAVPLLKKLVRYNRWRIGHKIMGIAYIIGIAHSFQVPTLTSELPIVRTYVYGMAAVGILSWLYTSFFYRVFNKRLPYIVSALKRFENDVLEVTMKPIKKHLSYKPGQFAFFVFEGAGTMEHHPFTISSHPNDETLRVTVKALGDYTSKLQTKLEEGSAAYVEGPFGYFQYKHAKHKKQVWLAGGIGITPFLSFLKDLDDEYEIKFVWAVHPSVAKNYREEIEKHCQGKDNIEVIIHDSEKQGHFSIDSKFRSAELENHSAFICGPEPMLVSYMDQLLQKGMSIKDIHYEEFMFR